MLKQLGVCSKAKDSRQLRQLLAPPSFLGQLSNKVRAAPTSTAASTRTRCRA